MNEGTAKAIRAIRNAALTGAAIGLLAGIAPASAADKVIVGLITKTNTNAFFAKMKDGAAAKAKELGVDLHTFAGKYDGDNESQVAAVENLINLGAKGILITPSDTRAIVPVIARARAAGILVIALDTPLDPVDAADATFATDNLKAGVLIGEWAQKSLGDKAKDAHVAFIDALPDQPSVDRARDQGFMKGFGIELANPNQYGHETDKRIVGHQWGKGSEEGGRAGMETLLQKDPAVDVVYTINEPTAAGAYAALKAAGKGTGVLVTSVDGGCPGVKNVSEGVIGATSMQYPLLMASLGVQAAADFAKTGVKPKPTPGLSFFDTGVSLVTDKPVSGIDSITSAEALKKCWG
ncbi:substrate-binding domain-containing protein [Methylocapsa sp. S129]|uniref:substrate-binding domain-containing protein n=1 Tax=Methylocapsa sp. S129 TaxID=1641869 RepID=UPI00131E624E|nr:substrate-binding domain-containing protein [Methylocapsa sp. S129]